MAHLDVVVVIMSIQHVECVYGLVLVRRLDGERGEANDIDLFLDMNATVCVN